MWSSTVRHSLAIEGLAFRLRPVEVEDAPFIVHLRAGQTQRTRYLHPVPNDVALQVQWIEDYFEREDDYYWVVERKSTQTPEGLVGIYNMDRVTRCAEWGRWVLKTGSLAAPESALLVYTAAFSELALTSVFCLTLAENAAVLSFHDSCGLKRAEVVRAAFNLADGRHDAVKHICDQTNWPTAQKRLESLAQPIAQRLNGMP